MIFDANGTTIDAFHAIQLTFLRHGMDIGDLERFQKRRKLFKYLGGLCEFPMNLRRQFGKQNRKRLLTTLTDAYRNKDGLYPGIEAMLRKLIEIPDIRVGFVSGNVTIEPKQTLKLLFQRHGIDAAGFDYFAYISLKESKVDYLKFARQKYEINPARVYACGDECSDYIAVIGADAHPFIVAYGFEDSVRLSEKFGVPLKLLSTSPEEFTGWLLHVLDISCMDIVPRPSSLSESF